MTPAVKLFLRGNSREHEEAILGLVCHDKWAHSTNQANLTD